MFKDIPNYEDYSVSRCGKVKSNRRGKLLALTKRADGYVDVCLRKNKERHRIMVHRLVAWAYIENPENKPHVNHKDSVRDNNHVDNLEWCTPRENLQHASRKGRLVGKKCDSAYQAVMTNEICHLICQDMEAGLSLTYLSRKYGINIKTLSNIKNGIRWLEIRNQYNITKETSRRLTQEEKEKIYTLFDNGYSIKDISEAIPTTKITVRKTLNKRHPSSTAIP